MKQYLPYNALVVAAVALSALMLLYNFVFSDTFALTVSYKYPGVPIPKPAVAEASYDDGDPDNYDDVYEDDVFDSYAYDEENTITSVTFPLDLNLATEQELRFIPQVGSVMAQRIVQYRDMLGGYENLEQLRNIKGVGAATYERISAYLILPEQDDAEPKPMPDEDNGQDDDE